MKENTQELIEKLKRNDSGAAEELLRLYESTIKHTAKVIYDRYNLPDMEEVLEEARQMFLILASVDFDPSVSSFSTFMGHYLHARLVLHFRPMAREYSRTTKAPRNLVSEDGADRASIDFDRREVVRKLQSYMWIALNEKELDIVINHMVGDDSRRDVAKRWGLSPTRIEQIYHRALKKLKTYLREEGIEGMEDV